MLGAVLGDIIGSYYEWNNVKTKDFPLVTNKTRYTDDSVMTLAVARWLLEDSTHSEEQLIHCMQKLGRTHIRAGYGGKFKEWLLSSEPQPYGSWGNGSAMRVSPVGLFAESESEARDLARITAAVTHNHPEGIKGAEAVAVAVYTNKHYARLSLKVRKIATKSAIERQFGYDLNRTLDEIRPTYKFDVSCQGSVPEAIIAYLESEGIEDCVRNAISLGGDSDTIAAIACSIFMAGEHSSKEGNAWTVEFEKYLPCDLKCIMYEFEKVVFPNKPTFNSYKVTDWLWAGEYPGDRNDDAARAKLRQFRQFGITHFIDLTEEGELKPYKHLLNTEVKHQRFPILDQHIPINTESVRQLLDGMLKAHDENPEAKFYIHCWGGVGRTGTIVGCFLGYYQHLDYDNAIAELKRLFEDCPKSASRISPENSDQFNFIKRFIQKEKIDKRYTPERITSLAENEIFVFGSNLAGSHGGGAALNPFCLERFLKAQEQMYSIALQEIEQGQKWSHWIWYIFPQLAVLGHSHNAKYYGLSGYDEAEAYLNHPVLGCRLREITQALLQHKDLTVEEILGGIDAMKVKSCMTLFAEVSPDDIFDEVLKVFYNGTSDKLTLELMY